MMTWNTSFTQQALDTKVINGKNQQRISAYSTLNYVKNRIDRQTDRQKDRHTQ